jgi:PAS domain S-box-containing protein
MSQVDEATRRQSDWILVALASVGTAIVVTDAQARVVSMNSVAETLTGWPQSEAAGQSLSDVFRIENELTRRPVVDPVAEVLASGTTAGVANHTILLARDGTEWILDDAAAPIRDGSGSIVGAVLVFRDVSERRRVERMAEDARAYAEGIVEAVREPLVVLDADLQVRTANRAFYRAFGTTPSQTEGRSLFDLADHQWDAPRLRPLLGEVLSRNVSFNDFELDREIPEVGRRVMLLNARRIPPAGGRPGLILLAIEDVTDRRRATAALEVSEARYRRLFETAQDGILIVGARSRRIFDANPFLTDLLGYSLDDLVGKELWEIGLFRDVEASKEAFRVLQGGGYIRYEDLPLRTKDGRQIEVEFVSNVYWVGDHQVVQCNIRDVSDRKRAEAALRVSFDNLEERVRERTAELAATNETLSSAIAARERAEAARRDVVRRLATAQEDERRRIARELHDQIGQYLAALGLGLKALEAAAPEASSADQQLRHLRGLTDLIGTEVHNLALEIRPTALDDLGLSAALSTYAEEWATRSGVKVDFQNAGVDGERLPPAVETAVYRVVQEAMTNVLRHARASHVSLVLQRTSQGVVAVVEDDGRGFDPAAASQTSGRLGLLGMRERVELVEGHLTVESAPGGGTTVIARIPFCGDGEAKRG